ncbi:hypothetical protein J2W42_001131 [Rhizobium tibeticum]|uniref:hypothetical protein n=1 Tax=Rhizobium tibeticum TaxID=501024 RepID=UPI0027811649|nr:hypothetical protein [Rhizobium tibeticum]MDP9808293.1 hypothetical protein [Rhizobium tibeticum]
MTTEFEASLRIPEGQQFSVHAEALREAIMATEAGKADGGALPAAIVAYLDYLSERGGKLRGQPGTMAEFLAVMHHFMPVPDVGAPASELCLLLTDLSVLYAANHLHVGAESSSYYEEWQRRRAADFDGHFYDAQPFLDQGAAAVVADARLDQATKTLIFERMAEVLHDQVFNPDDQLRGIEPGARVTAAQLFALQIWQLHWSEGSTVEDGLGQFFTPLSGSIENTLLFWIADPKPEQEQIARFCEHLFIRWGWIHPVDYSTVPDERLQALPTTDPLKRLDALRDSPLERVARRRITETDRTFPNVLKDVGSYGFEAIPILPVGGSEYGKTSFLCAFADRTISDGAKLDGDLEIRSNELQLLLKTRGAHWRKRERVNTAGTSQFELNVGRAGTTAHYWPAFQLSDYMGEDSAIKDDSEEPRSVEFADKLAHASGLFFFLDDRAFPLKGGAAAIRADELATWYEQWLSFFLSKHASRHLPIAIVINKADEIFGNNWFEKLGTTSLVVEGTQRGISLGTAAPGDPSSPYGRLKHAIQYNKAVGRDATAQQLLLQFVERFEAFFKTMLGATYRYQILLTTSVNDLSGKGPVVHGVVEAMSWMIRQLLPAFEQQAANTLDADLKALDAMIGEARGKLAKAKVHQKLWEECSADLNLRQGAARALALQLWDHLTGKTPVKLQESIARNAAELKRNLEAICTTTAVGGYPAEEAVPFAARWQVAQRAVDGLEALRSHLATLREAVRSDPVAATVGDEAGS